jgi:hypothetical protein
MPAITAIAINMVKITIYQPTRLPVILTPGAIHSKLLACFQADLSADRQVELGPLKIINIPLG